MRYFCTYFDQRYLSRALAMHASLRRLGREFRLWALCLDPESHAELVRLNLPGVTPIALVELEAADPELLAVKPTRSKVEYYFTCSPALNLYVLERNPEVDLLTYVDADLFFYNDPQPLYDELGDHSVGIIAHRFAPRVRDRARCGTYNVGWLMFRRDANGLACLRWWRERCLEWCYARVEGDRYADQKYLDRWPQLFQGVRVLEHKGANLGPWNLAAYRIREENGTVTVDGQPLLFFHFSSFLPVASWLYNTNFASWRVRPSRVVRRRIVGPYVEALRALAGSGSAPPPPPVERAPEGRIAWLRRKWNAVARILGGLAQGDHLVVVRGQVL